MVKQVAQASEFGNDILECLISADAITARVVEMGKEITRDYAGKQPHLVCVLKGATVFLSELMRQIDLPLTVDFIAVSSYGNATKTSGEVKILKDLDSSLADRDVIVVEDILDTGLTLNYLINHFRSRGVKSIRIAALLSKPSRRRVNVDVAYVGFEIPDAFVVGYGLDAAQRYRNLPYIAVLKCPTQEL